MVTAVERSAVADAAGSMHGFPAALTSFVGRAEAVREVAGQLDRVPAGDGDRAGRVPGRRGWPARWPGRWRAGSPTGCGWRSWRRCGTRRRWRPRWRRRWGSGSCPRLAAADALARALARRQLLLVLDNCEHVIGAAAELCGGLLLGADDVRVLATSREPLRIAGEARYRLAPLTSARPG